jgi:hypothetical protein
LPAGQIAGRHQLVAGLDAELQRGDRDPRGIWAQKILQGGGDALGEADLVTVEEIPPLVVHLRGPRNHPEVCIAPEDPSLALRG